jgi:hypothetical protein
MRDIYRNILVTQHLNPVVSTTTKTSTTVDLQGYNSANVLFALGLAGDTLSGSVYWTLKLTHSDDDSSYSDVALADLNNTAATVVVDAMSKDETVYGFGYNGCETLPPCGGDTDRYALHRHPDRRRGIARHTCLYAGELINIWHKSHNEA